MGRRGWSRRPWLDVVRHALYVLAEAFFILAIFFGLPALIWLMAPEGAAYPR